MADEASDVLDLELGGRTLGANLERAIARGYIVRRQDGRLALARSRADADEVRRKGGFIGQRGTLNRACEFLNHFLFQHVYGKANIPYACRDCYKIRILTRTLRALMAMKAIAEATPYTTKSGPEVDNRFNTSTYTTCLYFDDLEEARDVYRSLRARIDAHPELGPGVAMMIKRGCSNYERALGPSDGYVIDARLERAEAWFAERYVNDRPRPSIPKQAIKALRMLDLVEIAFRIGDETYKDFTGGQPLHPPHVDYSPDAQARFPAGDEGEAGDLSAERLSG
jgi:hypothetical protein